MQYTKQLLSRFVSGSYELSDLARELTLKSCEVEEVHTRTLPDLVVIGKVLSCTKHPDADKLTICQLDCGHHGQFQICTGATNIREAIYVPVALPGCYLPAIDLQIDPRKMRGVESNGMICSKEELGIHEDLGLHGIWILQEVGSISSEGDFQDIDESRCGKGLREYAPWLEGRTLDVENKTITHRPDMFGHFGCARELQAIFPEQIRFSRLQQIADQITPHALLHTLQQATASNRSVHIESEYVGAYSTTDIHDVVVQRSSFHQRLTLLDLGLSPKNNWVDFSNYFMYLTGQPIHCFDAEKIQGAITVRQAHQGESFVDLFDQTHTLTEDDIVICDEQGILALAGLVGGKNSGISDSTSRIVIEIAQFDPVVVRKTAMRLGMRTDAQTRFEKHIFPGRSLAAVLLCMDELAYLGKQELGNRSLQGIQVRIDETYKKQLSRHIDFQPDHIRRLIGADLPNEHMCRLLGHLGITYTATNNVLIIPVRRGVDDLHHSADIAEEIARIYGFGAIPHAAYTTTLQAVPFTAAIQGMRKAEELLTQHLGYTQLETYPWIHDRWHALFDASTHTCLRMENSMAPELGLLRHTMIPSMLELIEKNAPVYDTLCLYDIGSRWTKGANGLPEESQTIGLVRYQSIGSTWQEDLFLQMKQDIITLLDAYIQTTHLNRTQSTYQRAHTQQQTDFYIDTTYIGTIAQLHPQVRDLIGLPNETTCVVAQINLDAIINKQLPHSIEPLTLQDQCIWKDISFVIKKHEHYGHISDALLAIKPISDVQLVDLYVGAPLAEDEKSISLRFLVKGDGSLTSDHLSVIMDQAISAGQAAGGKLRGA